MNVISKSAVVMSWLREPKKEGINPFSRLPCDVYHNTNNNTYTLRDCRNVYLPDVRVAVAGDDLPGLGRRRAFIFREDKEKLGETYCTITNGYGPIEKYKERKVGYLVQ